ncbi:class I SAM-dependent methyltransferase [Synechococcus sp. CS-1332]|uniref:class I SAM-dependent methyltransferase n=1 Tax=Synechococcus sp. CS-1332 TaxID=2847972 RepID=UPI00223BA908|nr:class I SAM-dependent methyltransferase [Synechococcus sp. CS-1332]MCT0208180.1 class I SAM-dependent methyltransferase [Synechococcus sp. CS-1332]
MLEKICRNCGSSHVSVIESGCDLDPFFSYRVYGLQTTARVTSTRLRAGKKMRIIDRFLFGFLSFVARHCIDTEVSSWNTTDSMICHSCEFFSIFHQLTDSQLATMYHDYRLETYQQDWERFHPGYIKSVGQFIGGPDEAACRLSSLNPYLVQSLQNHSLPLDSFKSILDWGGSDGMILPNVFLNARRYVYDISSWDAVEGVTKLNAMDESVKFDYIQIMHVLEHIYDPLQFLEVPLAHLNKGGVLYLEVPIEFNSADLIQKVINNERRLKAHEHINLYTPRSLEALVLQKNLHVLDLRVETIDFHWCQGPCLRLLATHKPAH